MESRFSFKESPIFMTNEMVVQTIHGHKIRTRRPIKSKQSLYGYGIASEEVDPLFEGQIPNGIWPLIMTDCGVAPLPCPYGTIGDRLWVRETWVHNPYYDKGDPGEELPYLYRATDMDNEDYLGLLNNLKWRPSIHMPKDACRIFLEITDIRVERLHDISEEDARIEGVEFKRQNINSAASGWKHYRSGRYNAKSARDSFFSLWEKIYGEASHTENPFVWAISFKKT